MYVTEVVGHLVGRDGARIRVGPVAVGVVAIAQGAGREQLVGVVVAVGGRGRDALLRVGLVLQVAGAVIGVGVDDGAGGIDALDAGDVAVGVPLGGPARLRDFA
jgi:hypothetical protein